MQPEKLVQDILIICHLFIETLADNNVQAFSGASEVLCNLPCVIVHFHLW